MLRMCVCMHSRFVENHPIQILEDGPLISEVVLSHYVLASSGKGGMWHTYMVDDGGNDSSSSLDLGIVDGGALLRLQLGLASVQLGHLGVEGYLLAGQVIMALSCPPLDVDLLGAGLCLLFLLVSLLLIREELHSRPRYLHPHRDRRDGF
jgi:hypothetical protein